MPLPVRYMITLGWLLVCGHTAYAQSITLISPDGELVAQGELLDYDQDIYSLDTKYGPLSVNAKSVMCQGELCPDLNTSESTNIVISGPPHLVEGLLIPHLKVFSERSNLSFVHDPDGKRVQIKDQLSELQITFLTTDQNSALQPLIDGDADIALTAHGARDTEIKALERTGYGAVNVTLRGRVIGLDALVPTGSVAADLSAMNSNNWSFTDDFDRAQMDAFTLGNATQNDQQNSAPMVEWKTFSKSLGTDIPRFNSNCGYAPLAHRLSIKSEDYPFTYPIILYLAPKRMPDFIKAFFDYLQSPLAQIVTQRAGFVDRRIEEFEINAQGQRLSNAILAAKTELTQQDLQTIAALLQTHNRITLSFRFEAGSSNLDAQSQANIAQLANEIESGSLGRKHIVLAAFTDANGPEAANKELSQTRADLVRAEIISRLPADVAQTVQIEAIGFGETMPMACETNELERKINRRVEVWVSKVQ